MPNAAARCIAELCDVTLTQTRLIRTADEHRSGVALIIGAEGAHRGSRRVWSQPGRAWADNDRMSSSGRPLSGQHRKSARGAVEASAWRAALVLS